MFTHPQALGEGLTIVYRAIASFLIKKAGLTRRKAQCGAVTLIQRFGSALNLNVHFHMLIPDGVYVRGTPPYLRKVAGPSVTELQGKRPGNTPQLVGRSQLPSMRQQFFEATGGLSG